MQLTTYRPSLQQSTSTALRSCARRACLREVPTSCWDSEGVDKVDLEASSHCSWSSRRRSLAPEQQTLLAIYRACAVSTPTRRVGMGLSTACPACHGVDASMRHFMIHWPAFDDFRSQLQREFNIHPGWWRLRPRITAKRGWLCTSAARTPDKRARLQMAVARLTIEFMHATRAFHPTRGEDSPACSDMVFTTQKLSQGLASSVPSRVST